MNPWPLIERIGKYFIILLHDIGEFGGLYFAASFSPLYEGPEARKVFFESLVKQIYFTGVQAVRPIMIVSLLAGGIIIIQTTSQLPKVGAENMLGNILVLAVVREFGPLAVSLIIIGRSATAVTAEISEMKVSGQYAHLLTSGINPASYLFAPRFYGMIFSMLGLKIIFTATAIFGGFLMARAITFVSLPYLLAAFFNRLTWSDILGLILKSCFLASAISVISIREALKVKSSPTEIPQAASRTVVSTIMYVILIDIFFAAVLYL